MKDFEKTRIPTITVAARLWTGTAVLAGSWLLGRDYFQPAHLIVWVGFLLAAVVLLSDVPIRLPDRRQLIAALILLLPAAWVATGPNRASPVLLATGAVLSFAPIPRRWPREIGRGAVIAGSMLLAQSLVLWGYEIATARCHELPWPLAPLVGVIPRSLGVDTAVDGATMALRSMSATQRIAAIWELLVDPATLCFVAGGAVLLGFVSSCEGNRVQVGTSWTRSVTRLLLVSVIWLPVRVALLIALLLHRILRADAITIPNVGEILVSTWLHVVLLGGLVLLAIRLIPMPLEPTADADQGTGLSPDSSERQGKLGPILLGTGVAVLSFIVAWEPVGDRKAGRVKVVDRHSTWEPTTEPYGTKVYGEAGSYNYAAMYGYCEQFYAMSRLLETDAIDDQTLQQCDVLVIKTPTSRYTPDEVAAVVRFVEGGGSLLLIGDHTNVFNMNTYLNDIARPMGFTFRNDLLFRIGSPYTQRYVRPHVAHPILQHLPPMNFAVSCSIDPGASFGRMVIRNTGLYSLPPAYHESNYHPQAEYRPNMQYGAWCQLWSTVHGQGRVLAFADSTLFSNFCTFQPGKAELLVGMLEWLNHRSVLDRRGRKLSVVVPVTTLGVVLMAIGLWSCRHVAGAWLVLMASGWAGWTMAALVVMIVHRAAMPPPRNMRPMTHVVIDRTVSQMPLFTGAFADDKEGLGYGMLEQWIPRIGNYTSRRSGEDAFMGDGLVIICPTRSVGQEYRDRLMEFVRLGGKVLVFDSMEIENSTANGILWPFGLESIHNATQPSDENLRVVTQAPSLPLSSSCQITGGEPLAWWGETPVAAQARVGKGTVTAIGFGSFFNDANMGYHWLPEPDAELLERYEVLYALLRAALTDDPFSSPSVSFE